MRSRQSDSAPSDAQDATTAVDEAQKVWRRGNVVTGPRPFGRGPLWRDGAQAS